MVRVSHGKETKRRKKQPYKETLWAEFKFVSPFFYAFERRSKFLFYCNVQCELESLFFYAFECCSKFFFY